MPVPEGRPVADAEDAWAAAQEIGAPGRRQAALRQPRPRRRHQPHDPRAGRDRLRQRPRRRPTASSSSGSPRAPTSGCWSSAASSSPPPAASPAQVIGDGVRTDRPARRGRQPRPPPQRRPRDGPEQDRARPDRRSARSAEQGYTPDSVPAPAHGRPDPPQREPEHRRHRDRRHRPGPSRGRRPRRSTPRRSSASTSPASTSSPATSAGRSRSRAA